MDFTYWLPDENGNKIENKAASNSVIIIGANGSGKSKLGAWIEQQNMSNIHRIGAQRNLNFKENIPLKSYSQAEDFVLFGTDDASGKRDRNKGYRWGWGNFTTQLLDDFDDVLAAIIALKNNDNDKFAQECKAATNKESYPEPPLTAIDKLILIWNEIFPQRNLKVVDSKFIAYFDKEGETVEYSSTQMSDGERAVLYLTAQVLCVPQNKTLIIDEPEVHLNRSIMNRLWNALERYRQDCLFIYITHDTQFAAAHGNADKIWIKEFNGEHWKLQKLESNDLPEELLFDILGSRKNVLFVEGEKNSYDTQLYTILYPNYYVIACGSCTRVIARTKAFRNCPSLHHCEVYGLIDRDYRSDYEIQKYREENIYTLEVAEVENLFLVEELIRLMAERFAMDPDRCFDEISKSIHARFSSQKERQICQSTVAHLKYQLASIELSSKNNDELKHSLDTALESIDYDRVRDEEETRFQSVLDDGDYAKILRVFNEKGLIISIGHFLKIENKEYCNKVLVLLNGALRREISDALSNYLPPEIPR